ncbi:MAG: hypothetical protein M1833_000686 [Piccolia ochrophora]|nr:MAG: hypothetical protein M1833_000686 [Piccolia ochrophora]
MPLENPRKKATGREFYKSLGSPKLILAPMVDQSEFAWRLLTRAYMPSEQRGSLLAYTPMLHARMFLDSPKYRDQCFQPLRQSMASFGSGLPSGYSTSDFHLDGNPAHDRPLFVQFCANNPDELLEAARHVQPFCDAIDLNLGCPQGIAKRGHYGAFLQEDWDLVYRIINKLHLGLDIPITAKIRVLENKKKTLEYARTILSAGASILTVHGRQRHQKGHNTGVADWSILRYLRDNLPRDTVLFANGNILKHSDIASCLSATGADGVMSAEGNLYDPTIFSPPPSPDAATHEHWRGLDGKGGYRMDAVMRRYLDIIHQYVLGTPPPARPPLYHPTSNPGFSPTSSPTDTTADSAPPHKKPRLDPPSPQAKPNPNPKGKTKPPPSPSLHALQPHLFHLLRPLVAKHTTIRDALARCRTGDMPAFEAVLSMVEQVTRDGIREYDASGGHWTGAAKREKKNAMTKPAATEMPTTQETIKNSEETHDDTSHANPADAVPKDDDPSSSAAAIAACLRPWWICQPYIRPLPSEALEKGSMTLGKKERGRQLAGDSRGHVGDATASVGEGDGAVSEPAKAEAEGGTEQTEEKQQQQQPPSTETGVQVLRGDVVCR